MAASAVEHFLEFLEWGQVREAVAGRTRSSAGSHRARELAPSLDPAEVRARQARTLEARGLLARGPDAPPDLSPVTDVAAIFHRAQRLARTLQSREVLGVARTVVAGADARRAFAGRPALLALAAVAPGPLGEPPAEAERQDLAWAEDALAKIGEFGVVRSDASEALERLRGELKGARDTLQRVLAGLCADPGLLPSLAEFAPVEWDGTPCLRIKADRIKRVDGPIRGEAKDGSLFVEPDRAREHYNRIRHLELDERAEAARVVRALADALAPRREAHERLASGLIDADVHLALARYARDLDLVPPTFADGLEVELRAARHPLLSGGPAPADAAGAGEAAPAAADARGEGPAAPAAEAAPPRACVPIDVALSPGRRLVVISGPNGGGKTVAMKTVGLAAALAQSGGHVAAAPGARLPIFSQFVAVADARSSVAAGLSHFQAHARELAGLVAALRPGSLALLDEIGHGTDPGEAAALAQALLEHVLGRGDVLALATTHLGPLKAFAARAEGAANAAVELDEAGRPTFALQLGRVGRSYALEAARAEGLPAAIVDRAVALHGGAA